MTKHRSRRAHACVDPRLREDDFVCNGLGFGALWLDPLITFSGHGGLRFAGTEVFDMEAFGRAAFGKAVA